MNEKTVLVVGEPTVLDVERAIQAARDAGHDVMLAPPDGDQFDTEAMSAHRLPEGVLEVLAGNAPKRPLSRKAQNRLKRRQNFFIFSNPGFRGHRKYIGFPFRLKPPALQSEPILDDEGEPTKFRRAIPAPSTSLYQVHSGLGEAERRRRQMSQLRIPMDQMAKLKGTRVIPMR